MATRHGHLLKRATLHKHQLRNPNPDRTYAGTAHGRRTAPRNTHYAGDGPYTLSGMEMWTHLLEWLALPQFGLSTVFVIAFVSATLLPLGSEPAVLGLVKLNPGLFWPAVLVATVGNTLGGALSWWMGLGAHKVVDRAKGSRTDVHALAWLERFGARACLLSWLPVVGDPLCAVAGWLKLPFWPCVFYMAVGKFFRYLIITSALLTIIPAGL